MSILLTVTEQTKKLQQFVSLKQNTIGELSPLCVQLGNLTKRLNETSIPTTGSSPLQNHINFEGRENPITQLLTALGAAQEVLEMQKENPLLQQAVLTTEELVKHLEGQHEQIDKKIRDLQKLIEEKHKTLELIKQLTKVKE